MIHSILATLMLISFVHSTLCMEETGLQKPEKEYKKFATHTLTSKDKIKIVDAFIAPQTQTIVAADKSGVCHFYDLKEGDQEILIPTGSSIFVPEIKHSDDKTLKKKLKNIYYHEGQDYMDVLSSLYEEKFCFLRKKKAFRTINQTLFRIVKKEDKWIGTRNHFPKEKVKFFDPQTGFIITAVIHCMPERRLLTLGKLSCDLKVSHCSLYPQENSPEVALEMILNIQKNICVLTVAQYFYADFKKKRLRCISLDTLNTLWEIKVKDDKNVFAEKLTLSNDGTLLAHYLEGNRAPVHIRNSTTGDLITKIDSCDSISGHFPYGLSFKESNKKIVVNKINAHTEKYTIAHTCDGTIVKEGRGCYKQKVKEKKSFDGIWKLMIYNDKIEVYKKNDDTLSLNNLFEEQCTTSEKDSHYDKK